MIIEVSTSGGFGGLSAAGINKRVDTNSHSLKGKSEICNAFSPENLRTLSTATDNPNAVDTTTYKIIVTDDKQKRHQFSIKESQLPPNMLDMIDRM